MESTGVYWLPLYFVPKERGFDVVLVNARDVKNYSGRKTDESDAEWLMMFHIRRNRIKNTLREYLTCVKMYIDFIVGDNDTKISTYSNLSET